MKDKVRYTDMTEIELTFLFDALKQRLAEAEAETKHLRGQLARVRVAKYMGQVEVAHAKG